MSATKSNTIATVATGLLSYLLDYLILNPETILNWNSLRTGLIGAAVAYLGKNRKKIVAAVKGLFL